MDILRKSTNGMAGGNLIVVSDGGENVSPMINDIIPLVSQMQMKYQCILII